MCVAVALVIHHCIALPHLAWFVRYDICPGTKWNNENERKHSIYTKSLVLNDVSQWPW